MQLWPWLGYTCGTGTKTNLANVLTVGTAEYNALIYTLNDAAAELQKLENANVPVLWAPFHEAHSAPASSR